MVGTRLAVGFFILRAGASHRHEPLHHNEDRRRWC
nr:MAG TPA: hypothetical protein [Caudoviricetes sp.]